MNPFEFLQHQYEAIDRLLERLQSISPEDPEGLDLMTQFQERWQKLAAIEGESFYPNLDSYAGLSSLIRQARQEHEMIDDRLGNVMALVPSDAEWRRALKTLKDAVRQHVQREESEIFPKVRQELANAKIQAIGQALEAAVVKAMQSFNLDFYRVNVDSESGP